MPMDVAPELLEQVKRAFNARSLKSSIIRDLPYKSNLTQRDIHRYAEEVGKLLSESYLEVLTEANLPNGTLYRNIAERILSQTLRDAHDEIMVFAETAQSAIDEAAGLGIGTVLPEFPEERARGLIDRASDPLSAIEEQRKWLGEPVINNAESFADDFVQANARTRARMGLKTTITRVVAPGCCDWCDKLGGVYDYGDEPKEVYMRHEYCRCIVTFQSDRTSQNVWSKQMWESTPDEIERRVDSTGRIERSKGEVRAALENAARDQAIDEYAKVLNIGKVYARKLAQNLTVSEIEKDITKRRRSITR